MTPEERALLLALAEELIKSNHHRQTSRIGQLAERVYQAQQRPQPAASSAPCPMCYGTGHYYQYGRKGSIPCPNGCGLADLIAKKTREIPQMSPLLARNCDCREEGAPSVPCPNCAGASGDALRPNYEGLNCPVCGCVASVKTEEGE